MLVNKSQLSDYEGKKGFKVIGPLEDKPSPAPKSKAKSKPETATTEEPTEGAVGSDEEEVEVTDFAENTVKVLRELAKKAGIDFTGMNKSELVDALEELCTDREGVQCTPSLSNAA